MTITAIWPGMTALKKWPGALRERMRRAGDLVARYGGEEFVVIIPETDAKGTRVLAEELRATVEALGIVHAASETGPVVTVSVGCSGTKPETDKMAWSLVDAADRALYRAKNAGRNQVQWGEPKEYGARTERRSLPEPL